MDFVEQFARSETYFGGRASETVSTKFCTELYTFGEMLKDIRDYVLSLEKYKIE